MCVIVYLKIIFSLSGWVLSVASVATLVVVVVCVCLASSSQKRRKRKGTEGERCHRRGGDFWFLFVYLGRWQVIVCVSF